MTRCAAYWLGRLAFRPAWDLQNRLAGAVAQGGSPPVLLLLEHTHTYTIGRSGSRENVLWDAAQLAEWGVEVMEIDRGGDVTYHGPGQLVGYPILPLAPPDWQRGYVSKHDFVGYIRNLEACLIDFLQALGAHAFRVEGKTGVWVENHLDPAAGEAGAPYAKIASIGVKVDSKGVTRHGFALNVDTDLRYWSGIVPCGLEGVRMINLRELIPILPGEDEMRQALAAAFARTFGYEISTLGELEQLEIRLGKDAQARQPNRNSTG